MKVGLGWILEMAGGLWDRSNSARNPKKLECKGSGGAKPRQRPRTRVEMRQPARFAVHLHDEIGLAGARFCDAGRDDGDQPTPFTQLPEKGLGDLLYAAVQENRVIGPPLGISPVKNAPGDLHILDRQVAESDPGGGSQFGLGFKADDGAGELREHGRRVARGAADIE